MKKLISILASVICFVSYADELKTTVLLDVSVDPMYSGCFAYNGQQLGILVPARTSSAITMECVDANLPAGCLPVVEGVANSSYKLKLFMGEDSTVTVASDSSPSANDFLANTQTAYMGGSTAGIGGYGYVFEGSSWHTLTRADDADFDASTTTAFSIGCWAKHDTISAVDMIFNKRDGTGNTETGYCLGMDADGDFYLSASDNGGVTVKTATSNGANYDDNAWHYVVATRDTSKNLTLYVDGGPVTTVASAAPGTLENSSAAFVGCVNAGANQWAGSLDTVFFIKDVTLSAGQIAKMYNDANAAQTTAAVMTFTTSTAATAEYAEGTSYLYGYRGFVRFKSSAAQAADEKIIVYRSDR